MRTGALKDGWYVLTEQKKQVLCYVDNRALFHQRGHSSILYWETAGRFKGLVVVVLSFTGAPFCFIVMQSS